MKRKPEWCLVALPIWNSVSVGSWLLLLAVETLAYGPELERILFMVVALVVLRWCMNSAWEGRRLARESLLVDDGTPGYLIPTPNPTQEGASLPLPTRR